jgi:hypothetical protein
MRWSVSAAAMATAFALCTCGPVSAQVEKASALNGTLYAVIAPTYTGVTQSYIRLMNASLTGATTFSVTVVGTPSGRNMGTANISVPKSASPQYALTDIITLANAGSLTNGDTGYALYIQNPDSAAGFQHVAYNNNNFFFENASVCKYLLNEVLLNTNNAQVMTNVHTSQLASYPSTLQIHNYWNAAVGYRLTVVDAKTGATIGQLTRTVGANATLAIPFSDIESALSFTPTSSQAHVNVFLNDPTGSQPYATFSQAIVNNNLSAQINMSTACAVNAPANSSGTGGGGVVGY